MMRKTIKLGLLTAVASAILALPVAASAATPLRGEILSTTPQIENIQLPAIIEHNPPMYRTLTGYHNPPMFHNPPTYYIP